MSPSNLSALCPSNNDSCLDGSPTLLNYDADASNSSIDLNLSSHEDNDHESRHPRADSHRQCYPVTETKSATKVPFVPISEETIYLDENSSPTLTTPTTTIINRVTDTLKANNSSSPHSMDSWMNYSSNSSSEDYATAFAVPTHVHSSEDGCSDFETLNRLSSASINNKKQIYDNSDGGYHDEDDELLDDEHVTPLPKIGTSSSASSKRLRSKENKGPSLRKKSASSSSKARVQNSSTAGVADVRMIDFAHTTFEMCSTNTKIHHGPDAGFLQGLDSLKRILAEIVAESQ